MQSGTCLSHLSKSDLLSLSFYYGETKMKVFGIVATCFDDMIQGYIVLFRTSIVSHFEMKMNRVFSR